MTRVVVAGGGTGGHLMPALAIANALRSLRPDVEPVLVGAERGVEATLLPTRTLRYHLLPAQPIYRRQWWRNARWPLLVPRLWAACLRVLDTERPALVVGTGGYAAGPMLFAAVRRRIPIALQEQNAFPGVATRWTARWARQIHLGFPEARDLLRVGAATEVFAFGNPIAPPAAQSRQTARAALGLAEADPVVLVMGGSQGSRAINAAVAEALDAGRLSGLSLLWSTGAATHALHSGRHRPPAIQIHPFWDPITQAYAAADLVVARAGAMTLAELAAWGLPSILIPLPTAAANHQTSNARAFAKAGAALCLPEAALTSESLAQAIHRVMGDAGRRGGMAAAARARGHPDAANAIAERLLTLM